MEYSQFMKVEHHHPEYLPVSIDYSKIVNELSDARYALGLLEGSHSKLANSMHLIGPLVAMEAAVSSKIEGTESTASDIYILDEGGPPSRPDTPVVANYRSAMYSAIDDIKSGKTITKSMIKKLHEILLKDVRHKGIIGNFRSGSVWIAQNENDSIERAVYIPPEHMHVNSYVDNMLKYLEDSDDKALVKAGVLHYQFEAVHPFEDGNGRVGRLLIPIILFYKRELSLPIVYSSGYFEKRALEYRRALRVVDRTGEYEDWLKFFFNAIKEQEQESIQLIDKILDIRDNLIKRYQESKSPYMNRLIELIIERPVITIPRIIEKLGCGRITATNLASSMVGDKVLSDTGVRNSKGARLYFFDELLQLVV
jgi:Fic family protein